MFSAVRRARRVVSLVRRPPLTLRAADRWLVGLRWIAAVGMLATTLAAKAVVPGLPLAPLLGLIGAVAVVNLVWLRRIDRAEPGESFVGAQIAGDMIVLAAILWFSGGVDNPFAGFMTFQIALAGILRGGAIGVRMTALALVLLAILMFAPPFPLATSRWPAELVLRLSHLASLVGLGAFVGLSAYVYGQRIDQAQRESESNERLAMLGRIAGGMAHELNTPLATILLASDELVAAGREHGDEVIAQLAETLAHEARRASDVIELLRGRVRSDQRLERVDVAGLARRTTAPELARLGFAGRTIVAAPGPAEAWAAPAGLHRILVNVLTNAVQATAKVADPQIVVTVSEDADRVALQVADNGPGIPAEVLDQVGEPFRTTKELEGGTGLGLYVCSVLAERMGAHLALESSDAGATRVTLTLRKRAAERSAGG